MIYVIGIIDVKKAFTQVKTDGKYIETKLDVIWYLNDSRCTVNNINEISYIQDSLRLNFEENIVWLHDKTLKVLQTQLNEASKKLDSVELRLHENTINNAAQAKLNEEIWRLVEIEMRLEDNSNAKLKSFFGVGKKWN